MAASYYHQLYLRLSLLTTTMRSSSLLPTTWQDSPRYIEIGRLWESRRVRLVSFALAAVCFILILSAYTGPTRHTFSSPGPHWPPPEFDADHRPPPLNPWPVDHRPPPQAPVDPVWRDRAEQVKAAFVRGYSAYERVAYPHDELRPLTDKSKDPCVFRMHSFYPH